MQKQSTNASARSPAEPTPRVGSGYRQGLITAITVLLGFSLAFLRFWGLEEPGRWTFGSVVTTTTSAGAVVLQLVALFRALRPEDEAESEYRRTVLWFMASAVALVLGFVSAFLESLLG